MIEHEEITVPPEFSVLLEELAVKMVTTLKESTRFQHGPNLTIQSVILTIMRVGIRQNPDIVEKLKTSIDVAMAQLKSMEME